MDVIILMDRVKSKSDVAACEHQRRSLISAFVVSHESIIDKLANRKISSF